jgi:hypothetical protein
VEGGVLTTDEIYRGVKAKHAQLGQLLPPRWQEEVKRILEAHCISHEGNSWFLENIEQLIRQTLEAHRISHEGNSRFLEKLEPLEERPECETSLFDPHGTSERIINDSNRGQKRTDWANTESYRYLDLALGTWGFIVMTRFLRRLTGDRKPALTQPWPLVGIPSQNALWPQEVTRRWRGTIFELPDFIARISHRPLRSEAVLSRFPGSDESKRARRLREAMGFNGRGANRRLPNFLGVDRGRWNNVECGAPLARKWRCGSSANSRE